MNECAEGTHTCHENAQCTDVVGGFTCKCSTGFTGDGFVCQGMLDDMEGDNQISALIFPIIFRY